MVEQGTQTTQEEQKVKIKVQGEEKEITQSELIELAQKGDDYTAKTQKLAEERKRFEEETRRNAEELEQHRQYITQLEEEKQQIQQSKETADIDDPQEKRIKMLENEIAKMRKETEDTQVAQLRLQYERQLASCKQTYPLLDEQVVLAVLSANPHLKMEAVAKESHEKELKKLSDTDKIPQEAQDKIIQKYLESKKKQPNEFGGGPKSIPSPPNKEYTSADLTKGSVRKAAAEFIRNRNE